MANDFFLDELKKGPEHWNAWVRKWIEDERQRAGHDGEADWGFSEQKKAAIDLSQADLEEAHLEGAVLRRAHLEGADLSRAHLKHAVLEEAHLESADLESAQLEGAHLVGVHLEGAHLERAHLEGAHLERAHLEGAHLVGAHLEGAHLYDAHLAGVNLINAHLVGADLWGAHLEGALLVGAHLEGAHLTRANLEGADLFDANLEGTDLSGTMNIEFDNNRINGTRFTAHPDKYGTSSIKQLLLSRSGLQLSPYDDKWSLLRRNYTGSKMVLIWLALIAFVVPRIITGLWLYILSSGNHIVQGVTAMEIDPHVRADFSLAWSQWVAQHQQTRVIFVFLGLTEITVTSVLWAALTLSLMVYTAIRFWLTLQVSPLRDAETRSNRTPAKNNYDGLYRWHQRIAWILVLSVILAIWNLLLLMRWMWTTTVWVF